MRRISYTVVVTFFVLLSCDTDHNVKPVFESLFTKYYGADGNQQGVDLLVNEDGSMILLGNSSSQTADDQSPFMVKLDPFGNVLWQRQLGAQNESAVDVELDVQNNLIVLSNVGTGNDSKIRLFKLDGQGKGIDSVIIDSKKVGKDPGAFLLASGVTPTTEGKFLIAGHAGPSFVTEPTIPAQEDQSDVFVIEVNGDFGGEVRAVLAQGGEHEGNGVKAFSQTLANSDYLVFGDSDRELDGHPELKKAFEVIDFDKVGNQGPSFTKSGVSAQIQTASSVIETPDSHQKGYFIAGTTANGNSSNIYVVQWTLDNLTLKPMQEEPDQPRIAEFISLGKKLTGASAAVGPPDVFYVLGNEIRDNNKSDIFLAKLSSDGSLLGTASFGSLEGDDSAGAVRVLADGRIAVFGTMELETQKKMVLILLSPQTTFPKG